MTKVWELVLNGYNGATDATDNHIVWVVSTKELVKELVVNVGCVDQYHCIDLQPTDSGIDFDLTTEDGFEQAILHILTIIEV